MVSTLKLTKIQIPNSDSDVISLDATTGNIAFNKPVTGTAMVNLLDADISTVSQYDITSTYINSTYDEYILSFNLLPASDNASVYMRIRIADAIQSGSIYAYEAQAIDGGADTHSDAATQFRFNGSGIGNASGEGISGRIHLHNINNANFPFNYTGGANHPNTSGTPISVVVGGSLIVANAASIVNGITLFFNSGNIASGTVKLHGIN